MKFKTSSAKLFLKT